MFYFEFLLFFLTFSGERPFVCNRPNCCKSFVSKSKLVEHLQRHNGEKRHMCSLCGKKYANKHDLRAHTRYVSHALSIQWLVTYRIAFSPVRAWLFFYTSPGQHGCYGLNCVTDILLLSPSCVPQVK